MQWVSIADRFKQRVAELPDKLFMSGPGEERWSRADFDLLAETIADRLWDFGARPGDRVTAIVEKSPQAFALYLACQYGGFVYHPVNVAYTEAELMFIVQDAKSKVIVCDPVWFSLFDAFDSTAVTTLDASGNGGLFKQHEGCVTERRRYIANPDDWASLIYTSGTTGKPKGAMLSHKNLSSNAQVLIAAWKMTENDCLLHMLPIFHVHGLFVAGNLSLCTGCEIHFEPRFDIEQLLWHLPRTTVFMGVPTHYGRMLADKRLTKQLASNMRLFISGSAPMDSASWQAFYDKTGHKVVERYGMTETQILTSNPYSGKRLPGSVGLPLNGVDILIRKDNGELAQAGELGVVEVKGPSVFIGYYGLARKTAESLTADNYFITGDIGVFNKSGYLTLQGRLNDMIITGGYNVYPREVENALLEQKSVTEAAVFAVPHPDFGEGVTAVVIARNDSCNENMVISKVRQLLAAYKVPKRIFFLDKLPKNAMGKVDRKYLKARYGDIYQT